VTNDQVIRVATRALAVYLVIWAISDVIELPRAVTTMLHYLQEAQYRRNGMPANIDVSVLYYLRYSIIGLAAIILRIAVWLIAALWLCRCGPWLQRFFGFSNDPSTVSPNSIGTTGI
jgi:hypothetical protein